MVAESPPTVHRLRDPRRDVGSGAPDQLLGSKDRHMRFDERAVQALICSLPDDPRRGSDRESTIHEVAHRAIAGDTRIETTGLGREG